MKYPTIQIDNNRISIGDVISQPEIVLTDDEQNAVSTIQCCLEENGVDLNSISLDRVKEYLKLIANMHFAFCHLKLGGKAKYMELSISAKDAKRLIADPRFVDLVIGKKRFSRIPISALSDIEKYLDVVVLSYKWATITETQKNP